MKNLLSALMLSFLLVSSAYAQPKGLDSEAEIRSLGEAAMKNLVGKGSDSFFDTISLCWDIAPESLAAFKGETKKNRTEKMPQTGKTLGYEFLFKKNVGTSITGLVYLEKTEKWPIMWFLSFYKPADKWYFHSFYWNTQFEGYVFNP